MRQLLSSFALNVNLRPCAKDEYFRRKRCSFQVLVQGQFKEEVPMHLVGRRALQPRVQTAQLQRFTLKHELMPCPYCLLHVVFDTTCSIWPFWPMGKSRVCILVILQ